MENQTSQTQEQILQEILENSRRTRSYIKWQLIITIALVVIPFIAVVVIVPIILNTFSQAYIG